MSARYVPVSWTRTKRVYDGVLVLGIGLYLLTYMRLSSVLVSPALPPDSNTTAMDAYGTCAFLLLTLALSIGPLARLDPRLLPLLYNRRHLGVLTAVVATGHAAYVIGWYFNYSPTPPLLALLSADTGSGHWYGVPFVWFGMLALLVLWILAATSHDFWLAFLGPPLWKALHLTIYLAYAAVALHLAFGVLQDRGSTALAVVAVACAATVAALHVAAARAAPAARGARTSDGWIVAARAADIADGRAVAVPLAGGASAAIFRDGATLFALHGFCAHQNGPLAEGRIVDGCVVCPWHGYQYRPEDGCSPPPFTERVPTYRLRLRDAWVEIDPRPNPLGQRTELLVVPTP